MKATITGLFALTLFAAAATITEVGNAHTPAAAHAHASAAHGHSASTAHLSPSAAISRTITIRMDDAMRFTPSTVEVEQGETIRFQLHNDGQLMHEMVLGDKAYLEELAIKVRESPELHHEGGNMVHVAAGETGEVVWTFNEKGTVEFGCLLVGHFEAGMVGKVLVQ